jgi:hypothetical protein
MKRIEHNEEWLKSDPEDDKYLSFCESLEMPGYYFYDADEDPMFWYHILNRTGVVDFGEGMPKAKVAEPVSVGPFRSGVSFEFECFVLDNYVAEHLPYEGGMISRKAWYKFTNFEPEKWLCDFIAYMKEQEAKKYKNREPEQLTLF